MYLFFRPFISDGLVDITAAEKEIIGEAVPFSQGQLQISLNDRRCETDMPISFIPIGLGNIGLLVPACTTVGWPVLHIVIAMLSNGIGKNATPAPGTAMASLGTAARCDIAAGVAA